MKPEAAIIILFQVMNIPSYINKAISETSLALIDTQIGTTTITTKLYTKVILCITLAISCISSIVMLMWRVAIANSIYK